MNSKNFFYEFGRLLYQIDGFYGEFAKESGVKENLLWIMYALNDGKEHSQKEVCENWGLARSTVNTIMKELERDKYVTLSQIKGEKRELQVKLTNSGKEYSDNLLKNLYAIEKQVFDCLKNKTQSITESLKEILSTLYKIKGENKDE